MASRAILVIGAGDHTGGAIADALLVNGNRYIKLGDLPAGESRRIDAELSIPTGGPSFPYFLFQDLNGPQPREFQIRQQILTNYFQSYGGSLQPPNHPILIGWMRTSPLQVQVSNSRWATQQTSLIIATLNIKYAPGPVHLAPGDLP